MERNSSAHEKPQANWRARLSAATRFSKRQYTNCWHAISGGWQSIVRFPKLFEALLVFVGLLQGYVLWRTDEALHLAANAQKAAAGTAEKLRLFTEATERAWIGPASAKSDPFEAGKPIKISVVYNNTGRLLASFKLVDDGKFYTKDEWTDGRVSASLGIIETACMNGLPEMDEHLILSGMAYPTTGFSSYILTFKSDNPNVPEKDRLILTKDLLDENFIYVFFGCFVYRTGESAPHHSFFCFYHEVGISEDINNLAFCPFRQSAD